MSIKKFIIAVVLFILPLMVGFSIVKGSFSTNNDPRFSVSVLYEYTLTYPSDHIDAIRAELGDIKNMGFARSDIFDPDWSGNVFDDIAEIGKMIADFFVAIWDYISFCVKVAILCILVIVDGLVWILGFPSYLINV